MWKKALGTLSVLNAAVVLGVLWARPPTPRDGAHLHGLAIAHRGGSAWGPENTLEAIERSAERGATAVEIDVWLTADGVPVVLHDGTLDRTTNGTGPIGAVTLTEVRSLDADSDPQSTARVPTLASVLETAKAHDLYVEIELKTETPDPTALIDAVVTTVKAHQAEDRVWVGSFDPRLVYATRWAAPELITALCVRDDATGNPLVDRALTSRWLPWYLGVSVIEPHLAMVDADFVEDWRGRGYAINAWTANSASDQARMRELGVGFTSNCPGETCADDASDAMAHAE